MDKIKLLHGDCLELMKDIPDGSIDMILADLPYGTTACKWDTIIPFEPLWEQYKRIIKDNGAIVLFGSQPFTSALVMSKPRLFRHEWTWNKKSAANFMGAKYSPLKVTEDVLVFGKSKVNYKPIMVKGKGRYKGGHKERENIYGKQKNKKGVWSDEYYPKSIIEISNASQVGKVHPTQKPVALFEYLIKTYTNEGETVLDNCMGSGTTGVACMNTNRNFIGIELDDKYFEIAKERIESHEVEE